MHAYTTFRIGGPAEALYQAMDLERLVKVVGLLGQEGVPYLIVGKGSNLLIRDGGIEGVVILLRGNLALVERAMEGDRMVAAGGGVSNRRFMSFCKDMGLGGAEFLTGIPGTVGGAVAMNAGAFGMETASLVSHIQIILPSGEVETKHHTDLTFGYRHSSITEGGIIIKAVFQLHKNDPAAIDKKMKEYMGKRKASQPLKYPSAGSIFKNPLNDHAGRLIDRAGLKGKRIGGAMVSPEHGNWIVNVGGARAGDVLDLMAMIREKVRDETGIELQSEIRVVGR
jgi:UDP-N-acetylmuramate dehydrogenase